MKKTIKIIDLIVKLANEEKVPKKIKYDDNVMFYSIYDKDYLVDSDDEYIGLINNCEVSRVLNDEVEIIDEEEFEDIEECFAGVEFEYNKNSIEYKINQLIKNQKKIIEKITKIK